MHDRWKSALAGVLLLAFVFSTCLSGIIVHLQLVLYKMNVQTASTEQPYTSTIRIKAELAENSNEEFQWIDEHEFRFHGKMFDVQSAEKTGDAWVFTCESDEAEDDFVFRLDEESSTNDESKIPGLKKTATEKSEFLVSVLLPAAGYPRICTLAFPPIESYSDYPYPAFEPPPRSVS